MYSGNYVIAKLISIGAYLGNKFMIYKDYHIRVYENHVTMYSKDSPHILLEREYLDVFDFKILTSKIEYPIIPHTTSTFVDRYSFKSICELRGLVTLSDELIIEFEGGKEFLFDPDSNLDKQYDEIEKIWKVG